MAADKADKQQAMLRAAQRLSMGGAGLPALMAMTDPRRMANALTAIERLPRGAALVVRAYGDGISRAGLDRLARDAAKAGVLVIVAGDIRAGRHPGVAGIHLPERALHGTTPGVYAPARRARPGLLVTAAAHGERAILRARLAGVDAVLISPVFATASHAGAQSLGVVRFARLAHLAREYQLAPYALGGVTTAADVRRLAGSGACGIAGIGFLVL